MKIKTKAILFSLYCLCLAFGIPLLPPWAMAIMWIMWFPCGFVAVYLIEKEMKKRFGQGTDYFEGHHILAFWGIIFGGLISLLVAPLLYRIL